MFPNGKYELCISPYGTSLYLPPTLFLQLVLPSANKASYLRAVIKNSTKTNMLPMLIKKVPTGYLRINTAFPSLNLCDFKKPYHLTQTSVGHLEISCLCYQTLKNTTTKDVTHFAPVSMHRTAADSVRLYIRL